MRRLAAIAALGCACGDDAPPAGGPDAPVMAPWSTAPSVAGGAIQETAAVAVDGKVYVVGGFDGELRVVPTVAVFDTAAAAWSTAPDLPRAVHHANLAAVDGTLYVVGALAGNTFTPTGDVWSWTPGDAAWTPRASMPDGSARGSSVVGAIDGRIYVAGGLAGGAVATLSSYDPGSDAWDTELPPLPARRDHACGAVVGGELVVAGGRAATIDSIASDVYAYAPGGAWRALAAMPTARGGTACGLVGGHLVVAGGEGNPRASSGVFAEVEAYDPVANRWTSLPSMPTPRHGMAAAAWDGRLYVPGGATRAGFGPVATHEVLTP